MGVPDARLAEAAYAVADEYRDGRWPEWQGRPWAETWAFLVGELGRRCPGFGREEYGRALDQGFADSR